MIGVCAALALCACGPNVEVHGAVGNRGFPAKQATVTTEHPADAPGKTYVTLWIANRDQLCGYLGGALNMNYTDLLIVGLGAKRPDGQIDPPSHGGDFPIGPYDDANTPPVGNFAIVQYYAIDCRVRFQSRARSGTVHITNVSLDDGRYVLEGGFEADFGTDGAYSASFDADACANPVHAVIPISNCP